MKYLSLIATIAALAIAGCANHSDTSGTSSTPSESTTASSGIQEATVVVDNGFAPAHIDAKAGQPVSLTFDTKHKGCASKVIFKSLGIEKELTDGQKTVVTFTPEKAGSYGFACPMGTYTGTVVVK